MAIFCVTVQRYVNHPNGVSQVARDKNIKLSTRTALLFGFGLLLIISLSISLTWFFFLREINALELHATIETNRQAQQTIQIKLNDMASRTGDWAFGMKPIS